MNRRALVLATPFLALGAQAQELPARPIRLMVPFTTGGTTDILARILSEHGQAEFGQPIIVESRPGAGGVTGTAQVAAAAPDGTSLVMGTPGPIATAPALMSSLPYEPLRDLAPVMLVANVPNLVVVSPSCGITNIAQLIAAARARPGAIHFGSAGIGATTHLAGELFKLMTRTDMVHVPYRGSGPALQDLLGGTVQVMFDSLASSAGHVRAGRLRALAVTTLARLPDHPELPTVAETVPGYEMTTWYGMWGPPRMAPAVATRIQESVARMAATPEAQARFRSMGAEPVASTPEAFGRFVRTEYERFGRLIREADIKGE